jgi:alkanesulfonate monooxygenase SsuD/methylene tetrahydromethanopterin reductase-like flavin-dependent oxidoreductase (luciferase family)
LPSILASHFAPKQLFNSIRIYLNNFNRRSVIACVNVITADADIEATRLATSFKRLFLGILTGNVQQLKEAIDLGEGIMEPMEEAALQQMRDHTFIGGTDKV